MDSFHNSTSSDRQLYASSGASSTRHILGSPTGNGISLQPTTSGFSHDSDNQHRRPSMPPLDRRPSPSRQQIASNKGNHLLMESFSTGAVSNMLSEHYLADDNSDEGSTRTNFSTRSAPQTGRRSDMSISTNRGSHRDRRINPIQSGSNFEPRYLGISSPMMEQIIKHRRPFLAILFTILYAVYGLSHSISSIGSGSHSSSVESSSPGRNEWTHEMIAGWHRDRPLIEPNEIPADDLESRHVKIRECRSRAQQHHKQQHLLNTSTIMQGGGKQAPGAKGKADQSTEKPVPLIRRRHKFEALNGCFFRREMTSESMGDLCCCAGIPRHVLESDAKNSTGLLQVNATTASTATSKPALIDSSNKLKATNSSLVQANDLKQREPRKKYLKPHLMCFVSAAANLFNKQKLVAPIANEYNLMHTFIKGKGKCITCSCCHEHEPEKVNKLLANVPLYKSKSKSMMIDKNGNQLVAPSSGDDEENTGLWVRMRAHLNEWMLRLDKLFFWLYDLIDLTTFVARYGHHPVDFNDSSGLLLIQTYMVPLKSFSPPKSPFSTSPKPVRSTELPNLLIDDDIYDDFTTTTTTTTSTTSTTTTSTTSTPTTTTSKPTRSKTSSKGPKRRKKKRRQRTTSRSSPGRTSNSTTQSTKPVASTTTKSPTVIINVYAGNNGLALKEATTTSTQKPAIMLIASGADKLASAASDSGGFELRIKLNSKKDANATTIKTTLNNNLSVPTIELNSSSTSDLPVTIFANGLISNLNAPNVSTTTEHPKSNSYPPPLDSTNKVKIHSTGIVEAPLTTSKQMLLNTPHVLNQTSSHVSADKTTEATLNSSSRELAMNASFSSLDPSTAVLSGQKDLPAINTDREGQSSLARQTTAGPPLETITLFAKILPPVVRLNASLVTLPLPVKNNLSQTNLEAQVSPSIEAKTVPLVSLQLKHDEVLGSSLAPKTVSQVEGGSSRAPEDSANLLFAAGQPLKSDFFVNSSMSLNDLDAPGTQTLFSADRLRPNQTIHSREINGTSVNRLPETINWRSFCRPPDANQIMGERFVRLLEELHPKLVL